MKYKARYLETAQHDRKEITKYLNQYSLTAAKKLFGKIKHNMELVKANPYMYAEYDRRPQFRRMPVGDYLLFYFLRENARHFSDEMNRAPYFPVYEVCH